MPPAAFVLTEAECQLVEGLLPLAIEEIAACLAKSHARREDAVVHDTFRRWLDEATDLGVRLAAR